MALQAGKKLGPYEILSPLGAGGMGEVCLAKDSKLDRQVAIKVLPESMTRDPERVARFEREAKLLASLNHPNIAAIYGFDDSNGTRFLVMEYVEGETLGSHLKKGLAAVEDALDIAKQIAEALEAASDAEVRFRARYAGLAGRELKSWADPYREVFEDHRCRTAEAVRAISCRAADIGDRLPELVRQLLTPVYERFDFFELPAQLVEEELGKLRKVKPRRGGIIRK